jgi:hypothetical protein
MYKKILEMISYYFADEFKKQSLLLNKKIYTYKLLRVNPKSIYFITKDIITFNKNLKLLLKDNDFESPDDFKHVIKVNNNLQLKSIYLWSTDNNSTLDNLDFIIKEFISLSEELLRRHSMLVKYKKGVIEYQFNIRLLQPYITNIVDIRRCLLEIGSRG